MSEKVMGPPTGAQAALAEEDAIVMDKWVQDVCGEEDIQFPSHRRTQYAAYVIRLRRVAQQKQFVANTFNYPSRSGTREVLALQRLLELLGALELTYTQQDRQVGAHIARVRALLDEKTLGVSTLLPTSQEEPRASDGVCSEEVPQGYTPLGQSPVTDTPEYAQKLSIAKRYVAELARQTAAVAEEAATLTQRHAELQERKVQLDKEYAALQRTEEIVVERQREGEQELAKEMALLSAAQAQWEGSSEAEQPQLPRPAPPEAAELPDESEAQEEAIHWSLHCPDETLSEGHSDSSHHQRARDAKTPVAGKRDDPPGLEAVRQMEELQRLRAQLREEGQAALDRRKQSEDEERLHGSRFRQARQRLKDWQQVTEKLQRTQDQLRGQVRVVGTVLEDTAERLASSAAEGNGYMAQLRKMNQLLRERSAELMASYTEGDATSSIETDTAEVVYAVSGSGGAGVGTTHSVQPLSRPPPPSTGMAVQTPTASHSMRQLSASSSNLNGPGLSTPTAQRIGSSTATPSSTPHRLSLSRSANSVGSVVTGAERGQHRSRYELVSHLQRWSAALSEDRIALLKAAAMVPSERGLNENALLPLGSEADVRHRLAALRDMLLTLPKGE